MRVNERAVAVMGAGSWGTAVAKVMVEAGCEVTMWARRQEAAEAINDTRENEYLPGVRLPSTLRATADAGEALADKTTVVLGVPAQTMRGNLEQWTGLIHNDATLVSLAKGVELDSLLRMSQVIMQVTDSPSSQVAALSGPNLANEVGAGQPAATVIACSDSGRAVAVQRMLNAGYFRPYTNTDVIGAEVGGACKNVIALACGMSVGAGLGENTVAAIITRGLAEITRLGKALGGKRATLSGLAGVGDLVATCTSSSSRNRSFGERLGRGEAMPKSNEGGPVVEGVASCQSVLALASSYDVEMPLTDAVQQVCHQGLSVRDAVSLLLGRRTKPE